MFHRVVCFGALAENVGNSLRKGMELLAVGKWVDDSYTDDKGESHTHVVLEAWVVGPALRWATATVAKAVRADRVVDLRPGQRVDHAVSSAGDRVADVIALQPAGRPEEARAG